jgi:hypothetical protein
MGTFLLLYHTQTYTSSKQAKKMSPLTVSSQRALSVALFANRLKKWTFQSLKYPLMPDETRKQDGQNNEANFGTKKEGQPSRIP